MPVDIDSQEAQIVRKMVPFSTMPANVFKVICDKITVESVRSGSFLFKRGDTAKELVYLLKGEVSLEVDKLKMEVIKAGSESARFALAHQLPRKVNGVAKGSVVFARLNSIYITAPKPAALKNQEQPVVSKEPIKASGQNWLSTLLMIPVIRSLPPNQPSKIHDLLEEVQYQQGESVTQQGEVGKYYYLVKSGECLLTYQDPVSGEKTESKLKSWDSFGAEALICEALESQAVTALTHLSLLRLDKENFLILVKEPLIKYVTSNEMELLLMTGALLLDVRSKTEYQTLHLDHAVNIPFMYLRNSIEKLNKEQPVIIFSDNQRLSEAAAFLLLMYKFSVQVLH